MVDFDALDAEDFLLTPQQAQRANAALPSSRLRAGRVSSLALALGSQRTEQAGEPPASSPGAPAESHVRLRDFDTPDASELIAADDELWPSGLSQSSAVAAQAAPVPSSELAPATPPSSTAQDTPADAMQAEPVGEALAVEAKPSVQAAGRIGAEAGLDKEPGPALLPDSAQLASQGAVALDEEAAQASDWSPNSSDASIEDQQLMADDEAGWSAGSWDETFDSDFAFEAKVPEAASGSWQGVGSDLDELQAIFDQLPEPEHADEAGAWRDVNRKLHGASSHGANSGTGVPSLRAQKKSHVPAVERARSLADALCAELSWGQPRQFAWLVDLLEESGNPIKSRNTIRRLVTDGVRFGELALASVVRHEWPEQVAHNSAHWNSKFESYHHDEAVAPSWEACIQMIRAFSSLPDEGEFFEVIRSLHARWSRGRVARDYEDRPTSYFVTFCTETLALVDDADAFLSSSIALLPRRSW